MKKETPVKVTIKWYQDVLYIWPENMIRHIKVTNGQVHPVPGRRAFHHNSAYALLSRLPVVQQQQARNGLVFVVNGEELLRGVRF